MFESTLVSDSDFWKFVEFAKDLDKPVTCSKICSQLGLDQEKVESCVDFLKQLGLDISLAQKNGELIYSPGSKPFEVKMDLNLSEWIALQATFPLLSKYLDNYPFYPILKNKFSSFEELHQESSLYNVLEFSLGAKGSLESLESLEENTIPTLEEAIKSKSLIEVKLDNGTVLDLYPHKLIHLEGNLSLIGEDKIDHCLTTLFLYQIIDIEIKPFEKAYDVQYTENEVHEFIERLREMSGNEMRLILKVSRHAHDLELSPLHQFLGNPYVTKNTKGDLIWAATVEESQDLVDWLVELGDKVEILDPLEFKDKIMGLISEKSTKVA